MSVTDEPEIRLGEAAALADGTGPPAADIDELAPEPEEAEAAPQVSATTAAMAALLATAGAGWMLGGVFAGSGGRLVGMLGALIGSAVVAGSYRSRSPAVVQLLATPFAALVGIGLEAPSLHSGANPFSLVRQAIDAGGLSAPPVPFDPGWRLVLVIITCSVAVTAASAAVNFNSARLAALLPAPVVVAGVLLQSPSHELLSVVVSLALVVGALAVAFGAELSREALSGANFEARRLAKAGGLLLVIVALMVGLSQLGFLFPAQNTSTVIPPKQPETPPAIGNHLLFSARMSSPVVLRTGVLDVYVNGQGWLTPPYDPHRLVPVHSGAVLPAFESAAPASGQPPPQVAPKATIKVSITLDDLGSGLQVPDTADPVSVEHPPGGMEYDPRSETLQTDGPPAEGLSYTVTAEQPPSTAVLNAAKKPGAALTPYLQVPKPPTAVTELLDRVPAGVSTYERLQFVRAYYFKHAVAAGPGTPVDVRPMRVAQILAGKPASPYEITAGEVLLARWAGVPARIGYGYYDDTPSSSGVYQIYPSDGRLWLEAYFAGSGWVPILGEPAHAKASLDHAPKKKSPQIRPNGEITAQLYIPLRISSLRLLYSEIQYWLAHAVAPVVLIPLALWLLLPGVAKALRRVRRRRWAGALGERARIAVAYAELRDRAIDFNAGHPTLTPLEFLDVTVPDEDHTQLAWLVTRGLWGDLSRDLREEDAERAEQLSRTLTRRLSVAQPYLLRVAAFASRVSLRDPYTREVPNLWPRTRLSTRLDPVRRRLRAVMRRLRPRRPQLRLPRRLPGRRAVAAVSGTAAMLLCVILLAGCGDQPNLSPSVLGAAALPTVPASVDGFTLRPQTIAAAAFAPYRAQALISTLKLYAVRQDGVAVATLQTASFKPGLRSRNLAVRQSVIQTLGGSATVERVAGQALYVTSINQLKLLVHFATNGQTYELLAADSGLSDPDQFLAALLTEQQGGSVASVLKQGPPPADARLELQ